MKPIRETISEYLQVGGMFNPEIMNQTQHDAVRDTLIKARDELERLEAELADTRVRAKRLISAGNDLHDDVLTGGRFTESCLKAWRDALHNVKAKGSI